MPILLGCGGCGLLIVLALVAFFLIGKMAERTRAGATDGSTGTDTTMVTAPDTVTTDATSTESTSDGTGSDESKPSDKPTGDDQTTPSSGDDTLPEIRRIEPINP